MLNRISGVMNRWVYQMELLPRPDYKVMPDTPSPEKGKEAIEGINRAAFVSNTPPKDLGYNSSRKLVKPDVQSGVNMDTVA